MPNRLNLDFKVSSDIDRADFINKYVKENFKDFPPTEDELEMMANYMLWGRDCNGKNAVQRKEVDIPTRYTTWQKEQPESLDALTESPNFNEAIIRKPTKAITKTSKTAFNREEALQKCPGDLKPVLIDLFQKIDELDYTITIYDINHGNRINPPREELLARIPEDRRPSLEETAKKWNQRTYLRQRHQLVEMRREQYTLRDVYAPPIQLQKKLLYETPADNPEFGIDVPVYPLGLYNKENPLFFDVAQFGPEYLGNNDLKLLSNLYWEQQSPKDTDLVFDFRNKNQVYQLLRHIIEAKLDFDPDDPESTLMPFFDTLNFYIERANLSSLLSRVLEMKMRRCKNPEVREAVNAEFNKSYTDNYISTIFKQQVIPRINAAAAYHFEEIGQIFFPEAFKKCKVCGKYYLIDGTHFTKRTRSKDGYSSTCKLCDKKRRDEKGGK